MCMKLNLIYASMLSLGVAPMPLMGAGVAAWGAHGAWGWSWGKSIGLMVGPHVGLLLAAIVAAAVAESASGKIPPRA